ncbi:helix-turn-helix transcriptional regulator [Enterococcus faecalis]|nr:helix-turn-helix transcriptional regulator [Enterococcus faecalis]
MWSKIEKIMIERGMNQNQLAKNMGVRNGIITDLKKGRIKVPSFQLMVKIADALGVSLDVFR